MRFLTPIKRFLSGRPLYKRVESSSNVRRQSESATSSDRDVDDDDDNDAYAEHDELVHGKFVYCAFVMMGMSLCIISTNG
jgi:hypothetical protein